MVRTFLVAATVGAITILGSSAEAKVLLRLNYNDLLETSVMNIPTTAELDFVLDRDNVSVYERTDEGARFVGDRRTGRAYYYGPLQLKIGLRNGVVDLFGIYRSHVVHTRVTSDGQTSCSATIRNTLKPGFSTYSYEVPGWGSIDLKSTTISNVRCQLSVIP